MSGKLALKSTTLVVGRVGRVLHGVVLDREARRRQLEVVDADEPGEVRRRLERQVLDLLEPDVDAGGTHDHEPEVDVLEHETGGTRRPRVGFVDHVVPVGVGEIVRRAFAGEEVDAAGAERECSDDAFRPGGVAELHRLPHLAREREAARDVEVVVDLQDRILDRDLLRDGREVEIDGARRASLHVELAARHASRNRSRPRRVPSLPPLTSMRYPEAVIENALEPPRLRPSRSADSARALTA